MKTLEWILIMTLIAVGFAGQASKTEETQENLAVASVRATRARTILASAEDETHYRMTDEAHEIASESDEINKMHQRLIGNIWLPGGSEQARQEKQAFHHKLGRLENLVEFGLADEQQKAEYLALTLTLVQDRIEMIQYFHQRLVEIEAQGGVKLIPDDAIEAGQREMDQLEMQLTRISAQM